MGANAPVSIESNQENVVIGESSSHLGGGNSPLNQSGHDVD